VMLKAKHKITMSNGFLKVHIIIITFPFKHYVLSYSNLTPKWFGITIFFFGRVELPCLNPG
jgi:hypothetical protein